MSECNMNPYRFTSLSIMIIRSPAMRIMLGMVFGLGLVLESHAEDSTVLIRFVDKRKMVFRGFRWVFHKGFTVAVKTPI